MGGFCKIAERGKEGHRQIKFTGERGNSGQKQHGVTVLKVEVGRVTMDVRPELDCKGRRGRGAMVTVAVRDSVSGLSSVANGSQ